MDFEKIAREKIKQGCISVETLAEWFQDIYEWGHVQGWRDREDRLNK